MSPRNIAIVGKMYAGKTTLANQLCEDHDYSRVAMAGPLKLLAKLAYGEEIVKDRDYYVTDLWSGSVVAKTGREILQGIGQALKVVDRDIWLKIFEADTTAMNAGPYVCDDVRFQFEVDYLREKGWVIVKVDTPDETRISRAERINGKRPTKKELEHESEREVGNIEPDLLVPGDLAIELLPEIATMVAKEAR